jgi:putative tryptophan/tyrosine transport system substrate-binding protein
MKRREFIAALGGAAVLPFAAQAQKPDKVWRVGVLTTANPRSAPFFQAFEERLRDLGYVDGLNIAFDYRNAEGELDRLPGLAAELVYLNVNIIVTSTDLATRAAKAATGTIPIIMVAINYDPIALGFIDSIARPGGNITGLFFQHLELVSKRFGLFNEMLPNVQRVAILFDRIADDQLKQVQASNRLVGFELQPILLEKSLSNFKSAFEAATQSGSQALFVLETASIFRGRSEIAQLAIENRLPTSFAFREYVEVGGLASYGVNFSTMYRRAAEYADRLLRGAKPIDLPVEQSTKFDLVINLKTAKALGISVPAILLGRADEVIA